VPHRKLSTNRTLRAAGASAAALALLALPLAAPAVALSAPEPDELVDLVVAEEEEHDEDQNLAERVLAIAERLEPAGDEDEGAALTPAPSDSTMEPAGGSYEPVSEPAPAPAQPEGSAPAQAAGSEQGSQAAPPPPAYDANGPRLQGWAPRSGVASSPVQSPLVAGPVTVPAPQFADPAAVTALAGAVKDGWTNASAWTSAGGLDPYSPTQWPFAIAAGLLLFVGGGHPLRLYDQHWKATVTTTE
jgi:hypothetical protein